MEWNVNSIYIFILAVVLVIMVGAQKLYFEVSYIIIWDSSNVSYWSELNVDDSSVVLVFVLLMVAVDKVVVVFVPPLVVDEVDKLVLVELIIEVSLLDLIASWW